MMSTMATTCTMTQQLLHPLVVLAIMVMVPPTPAICPSKCVCDDETLVVRCERANLDVVPIMLNPGVRELSLRHNNIRAVIAAFSFYKDLEWLDLSHNRLSALETGCFEAQRRLRVLHLSRNQLMRVLNSTFTGLQSLRVLRLDANHMTRIDEEAFAPLTVLQELDLSDNRLQSIHAQAFVGLDSLGKLSLARNRLTAVPSLSPPLPKVQHFVLDGNPFYALPSTEAFEAFPALLHLSLDSCRLSSLSPQALTGPKALRSLRLRDNALTEVPSKNLWVNLQHLEDLAIGANAFEQLGPNIFWNLTSLRTLELNGCPKLQMVHPQTFSNLPALVSLSLSHNPRLVSIHSDTLRHLPNLRHLSLRSDGLTTFPESLLEDHIYQLDTLDIRDNPMHCNCTLRWLHRVLCTHSNHTDHHHQKVTVGSFPSPKCRSPAPLRGTSLATVEQSQLLCDDDGGARHIVVFAGIAAALVLGAIAAAGLAGLMYRHKTRMIMYKGQWPSLATDLKEDLQKTPVTEL